MNAKIEYALDFETEVDPYRRDTGGQTVPQMYLVINDDDTVRVVVSQSRPGQTGVWTDDLVNVDVTLPDETPDADEFEAYIRSDDATALIARIVAGYSADWSGRHPGDGNLVTVLDDDATAALAEMESAIADLSASELVWWNIDEWFRQTNWSATTAAEVDAYIADPVDMEDVNRLVDDPTDYILENFATSLQDELELTAADSDMITARGATVLVKRDDYGDIETVLEVLTPAGHRWQRPPSRRGGAKPNTSLYLPDDLKTWLREHGGIQPTITKLVKKAMTE